MAFIAMVKNTRKYWKPDETIWTLPIIPKTETNHHKFSLSSKMSDELEI